MMKNTDAAAVRILRLLDGARVDLDNAIAYRKLVARSSDDAKLYGEASAEVASLSVVVATYERKASAIEFPPAD